MISVYTGLPGSGKSLHAVSDIAWALRHGKRVIANFPVRLDGGWAGYRQCYVWRDPLPVRMLWDRSLIPHKEGDFLLVMDEAQLIFNSRDWQRPDNRDYIRFFSQHRKLGYDVILVTQQLSMIDKQIRACCEVECNHRRSKYITRNPLYRLILGEYYYVRRWIQWSGWGAGGKGMRLSSGRLWRTKEAMALYDTNRIFAGGGE